MLIVQVYLYSEMFPKDKIGIKALVYFLFLLETAFTIFTTIAAWDAYGPGWGDTGTLLKQDWSWEPLPAFNGVSESSTLSSDSTELLHLAHLDLDKINLGSDIIGCVMLTQMTAVFYVSIKLSLEGLTVDKLFALSPEITLWVVGDAVCDVFITVTLVYILSRQKKASIFQQTNGLLNKLIRLSIETGTVTTAGASTHLILWLTCRQWNIHFILYTDSGLVDAQSDLCDPTVDIAPQTGLWFAASGVDSSGSRIGVISRTGNANEGHNTIVMNCFDAERDGSEGQNKSHSELAV
ncbi:hypothetical protein B0H14DRAFT_2619999 [Mycena olivaceomarginata]|nr:hypothetical protein B0H14DRAFT_2619999 [Mycena olivaceomarginata]